jgi:prophage regulatory protein
MTKTHGATPGQVTPTDWVSILRMDAVKVATGHRSHASIYNAIKAGLFTTGVLIGQRSVGWPQRDVTAINLARIAGKSDAEIRELVKRLHAKRLEPAMV